MTFQCTFRFSYFCPPSCHVHVFKLLLHSVLVVGGNFRGHHAISTSSLPQKRRSHCPLTTIKFLRLWHPSQQMISKKNAKFPEQKEQKKMSIGQVSMLGQTSLKFKPEPWKWMCDVFICFTLN